MDKASKIIGSLALLSFIFLLFVTPNGCFIRGYVNFSETRDPTFSEMITFLEEDKTDEREYNVWFYNCISFSTDLIINARARGLNAKMVKVDNHAIVAFNTTDAGTIFIEPQTDEILNGYSFTVDRWFF